MVDRALQEDGARHSGARHRRTPSPAAARDRARRRPSGPLDVRREEGHLVDVLQRPPALSSVAAAPPRSTTADCASCAFLTAVMVLVTPGPAVTAATPGTPVSRKTASAAKTASTSWRTSTTRMPSRLEPTRMGEMWPPQRVKRKRAPARTSTGRDAVSAVHPLASRDPARGAPRVKQRNEPDITVSSPRRTSTRTRLLRPSASSTVARETSRSPTMIGFRNRTSAPPSTTCG